MGGVVGLLLVRPTSHNQFMKRSRRPEIRH